MRAKLRVRRDSPRLRARKVAKDESVAFSAAVFRIAFRASANASIARRCPSVTMRCVRTESSGALPALCSRASVTGGRPWMNSAPSSTGAPRPGQGQGVDGRWVTVERGEVLGCLGPNGAGKSTTMRMITGFMPPTAGRVTVGGYDVVESPLEAKRLIGYLPENAAAYPDMTVKGF